MVVESWKLVQGNQNVPLFARGTFLSTCRWHAQKCSPQSPWMSPDYGAGKKGKKKSCSFFWSLSGVLEMEDGLDRTGKKKTDKNGKNFMHWNVAPDALPGSARLVCVLDR